jgi:hypothetical protein
MANLRIIAQPSTTGELGLFAPTAELSHSWSDYRPNKPWISLWPKSWATADGHGDLQKSRGD